MAVLANVAPRIGGDMAQPEVTDLGTELEVTLELSRLGNTTYFVDMRAEGTAILTCTNPARRIDPVDHWKAEVVVKGETMIRAETIVDGSTKTTVTTEAPPLWAACPSPHWIQSVDIVFQTMDIGVTDKAGDTVALMECAFAHPTRDGTVQTADMSCTH